MKRASVFVLGLLCVSGCGPKDEVPQEAPSKGLDVVKSAAEMVVSPAAFAPGDTLTISVDLIGPPDMPAHTGTGCKGPNGEPSIGTDRSFGAAIIPVNDDGTENKNWKNKSVSSESIAFELIPLATKKTLTFSAIIVPDYRKIGLPDLTKIKIVTATYGHISQIKSSDPYICTQNQTKATIAERIYEYGCGRSSENDRCAYRTAN